MPKKAIVERNTAENVKLKRRRIAEIEEEEKSINYKLFNEYFISYQSPSDLYKKLSSTEGERNEDQVYVIKKVLNKMKKTIEKVPEDRKFMIQENKKIINIVERLLYFNELKQKGQGLKKLTPNQMLSRLPISLAQLKAGSNSEKLWQLLYSLYRSKKLTKQLYKSLIDTI